MSPNHHQQPTTAARIALRRVGAAGTALSLFGAGMGAATVCAQITALAGVTEMTQAWPSASPAPSSPAGVFAALAYITVLMLLGKRSGRPRTARANADENVSTRAPSTSP